MQKNMLVLVLTATLTTAVFAETVHRKAEAEQIWNSEEKGHAEFKEVEGASGGKVARAKGSMPQWGYIAYYFDKPVPAGKSILRARFYVDKEPTSQFIFYTISQGEQKWLKKVDMPKDAKPGTFVILDFPVDSATEWNAVALKKFDNCDDPGLWLDYVSVVLP